MKYTVKNWHEHQHYKDRNPPWIKLKTDTFQDYDFSRLQDASKLLAVCIWTLASRSKDGSVPADLAWIKNQCSIQIATEENLQELVNAGFIMLASEVLADCKQSARPETEERQRRGETETVPASDPLAREMDFKNFLEVFPLKANIVDARKRFAEAITKTSTQTILEKASEYRKSVSGMEDRYIQNPAKWLENERWTETFANPKAKKNDPTSHASEAITL